MPTPTNDEMWREIQGLLGRVRQLETLGSTNWTPTIVQGATNNIAKTINYAKFFTLGHLIVAAWDLTVTGTGTANNQITLSAPVTAASGVASGAVGGTFRWFDSGTRDNWGHATLASATTICGQETAQSSYGSTGSVDANALANNDVLRGLIVYEAA